MEEKTKEKPLYWQISIVWFIVFLFIFSRQTTQHCVLGKSQAEKSTSEWLSHPSSCDSGEEWMPHLDTGDIERIYLGVSLFVCVPWAELLRDSSTDEMKSILTRKQRKAFEGTERQKATDSRAYSSNMQPLSRLRVLSLACKITSLMYLSVYFFCLLVVSVYAFLPAFLTTSLQVCPCLCVVCLYSLTPLVFLLFCWTSVVIHST